MPLAAILARVRAGGLARVQRRPGEPAPDWDRVVWPVTIADVLAAPAAEYAAAVRRWAEGTLAALAE